MALAGSGDANPGPSTCGANNGDKPAASASPLGEWFDVMLHGLPADVYTLGLDGGGLTRIADIKDDDPTVAWSPDGSRLAIFGVAALSVVDSKGGPTQKLVEQGGYGGLDWTH